MNGTTNADCCTISKRTTPITVGENLDEAIKNCRKELERLCVVKTRAEALQMLEFPVDEVRGLVNIFTHEF